MEGVPPVDLIIARPPEPQQPSEEEQRAAELAESAEEFLDIALADYLRAKQGLERTIRMTSKYLSVRRIFVKTGITRRRIDSIIANVETFPTDGDTTAATEG